METKTEEWRAVAGYEGLYEVSNLGRVRSLDIIVTRPHPKDNHLCDYKIKGRMLMQLPSTNGYLFVHLYKDKRAVQQTVHRLVSEAFVPGYFDGAHVNHKDENKHNNRADNLEWVTRRENSIYGTCQDRLHKNQRKPVIQLTLDGKFVKEWPSVWSVNYELGIDPGTIVKVCKGKSKYKTAGGFSWKYKE
jgi:hypothetical protein